MLLRDQTHFPSVRFLPGFLAPALLVLATLTIGLFPPQVMAAPIGLMERFALAQDREAVLAELIPGSDDFFFYHCLHYQNTSQLDRAEAMLKQWYQARKSASSLMESMSSRQRLLTYDQNPQQTIDYFVKRLGIQLSHVPPVRKGTRRYASELDASVIDTKRLVADSLRNNTRLTPAGMRIAADFFRSAPVGQQPISLNAFLQRVGGAYLNDLDQLVIAELKSRSDRDVRFGDLAAHRFLTLEELDRVGNAIPAVKIDNDFVNAKLRMLRPSADVDLSQQPDARREYLQRLEAYVRTLPAGYNSLKASATYRLLESNRAAGLWDKQLLIRYLALPRQSSIVSRTLARSSDRADLGSDYTKIAILPPIGDETPLVESYLEHFLRDAKDTADFQAYVQPDYLRRIFARTKLMAGVSNPQPFFDMLSATERRELRDKIQLSFAAQNPLRFSTDDPTELLVDLKNIDKLVIRVYEMNSLAFHRTNKGRLDTNVELDGLLATHEKTITYDRPSIERHRESINIPEINGRGAWIVDLVGKGLRARALIRRGDLQTVQSSDANGTQITVLDENRKPVAEATIYVSNQAFQADENGRVTLPLVAEHLTREAIVSDGKLAEKLMFIQRGEDYKLAAGFYVDQTLLQSGRTADLLVRPRLTLGDTPVDPAILKDASVRVVATDLDGIQTTKQFDDVKLDQSLELQLEFRVPTRIANLEFELSGHVIGLSDRRKRDLSVRDSISVAGIRRTAQTEDAFLTRDGDEYVIETRGRTGELVPGETVRLWFGMDIGDTRPNETLQSDDLGQVRLGQLEHVSRLQYGIAGGSTHEFDLKLDRVVWPSTVRLASGTELRLPTVADTDTSGFRLLELRDGVGTNDLSDRLKIENGFLTASKLPVGNLSLLDRETGTLTRIAVVDGQVIDQVLVGKVRHMEQHISVPLSIGSTKRENDGSVTVQLAGNTNLARVHVIATRYFDRFAPIDRLDLPRRGLSERRVSLARSGYVSDLKLGDEYEYVLRRQYATKYPGVMLPQPSVLLNPWETETTSNASQAAAPGDAPPSSAAAEADSMRRARATAGKRSGSGQASPDFDFLSDAGAVVANLIPDADGRLNIPANVTQGMPLIQIVVTDPVSVIQKTITAPLPKAETEDLRLAKALPIDQALSFERAVSVVSPEQALDLTSLGTAQIQVYGDVATLLNFYRTLVDDSRLDEFQILGRWHTLTTDQKLSAYSKLACHELHLFLFMHDREFFDSTIKPYLANKKEKQFLDDWLLGRDLSDYATLWRYQQLSAVERALLAARVPDLAEAIRRDLFETVALQEIDNDAARMQIDSALRSQMMSDGAEGAAMFGMEMRMGESIEAEAMGMDDLFDAGGMMGGGGGYGGGAQPSPAAPSSRNVRQQMQRGRAMIREKAGSNSMLFGGRAMAGKPTRGFFQSLDSTKQWAESHWDQVRVVGGEAPIKLIPINPFWNELANNDWSGEIASPAVSKYLLQCNSSRHAVLAAIAMSGLPLKSGEISLPVRPKTEFRPEHSVALITKRLRTLESTQEASSVLIGQMFRRLADQPRPGQPVPVLDQFVTGEAYQGQVVVSNPTAQEQTVELFWQIPAGSIALSGNQITDSKTVRLKPFAVSSVDYQFYFPQAGTFKHYPATVSRGDELLAKANEKSFQVQTEWLENGVTWQAIARDGTPNEIRAFLKDANLHELDWSLVLHRLKDRDVYQAVLTAMKNARLPEAEVWAYGFHHNDPEAMQRFLSLRQDLIAQVGPSLESKLLTFDSIEQRQYEHLEYAPLVRARIHRLGDVDEILNPTFLAHYQQFVRRLGFQAQISPDEKMPLTYYLLLQNRIEQAIEVFRSVDRDAVETNLQYDYLAGYLNLHLGQYEEAAEIARKYQTFPIERWRGRFDQLQQQIRQRSELMDAGQMVSTGDGNTKAIDDMGVSTKAADLALADRERANSEASALVPEVIVKMEDDAIRVDHRNTDQVEINFYGVDLELLFSNAPFARQDLARIAMVRPTQNETLQLATKTGTQRMTIPVDLRNQTLLVEANVGSSRSTTLYYGGNLTTYVSEAFGQLQTTDTSTHRPVAGAYVKVYGRYPDGSVRFFKDGYTDGRGRFDYTSISAADAQGAERFAILVLSDGNGATLHDVKAP